MISIHILKQLISLHPSYIVIINILSIKNIPLILQRYHCKIPNYRKTFNKRTREGGMSAKNYIIKINNLVIFDVCQ